jgi:hypothetical protein
MTRRPEDVAKFHSTGLGKAPGVTDRQLCHPVLMTTVTRLWECGRLTNLAYKRDPIVSVAMEIDKALRYGESMRLLRLSLAYVVGDGSVNREQLESDLRAILVHPAPELSSETD